MDASRRRWILAFLTIIGAHLPFVLIVFLGDCGLTLAQEPRSIGPTGSVLYDPDPGHLWNRLHHALHFRETVADDEREIASNASISFDPNDVDPFSWDIDYRRGRYLLAGPAHQEAIAILDEFIAQGGDQLFDDPVKRALLQRDLWTFFDWTTNPYWSQLDDDVGMAEARRAFQTRLVQILPRLALSGSQIEELPDTYAATVAAHVYPTAIDADDNSKPFLPADLWQTDGSWVMLGDSEGLPLAEKHEHFFNGRSAFLIFLRLPGGRTQTLNYLEQLKKWKNTHSSHGFPEFPPAAQTALVRRMLLIDQHGQIRPTPLTEQLQLRVIHEPADPENGKLGSQSFLEFRLQRSQLLGGNKGSLELVPGDQGEWDHLTFLGSGFGMIQPIMASCRHCHSPPGLLSMNSSKFSSMHRSKGDWGETTLAAEMRRIIAWKNEQFTWGLLEGLRSAH